MLADLWDYSYYRARTSEEYQALLKEEKERKRQVRKIWSKIILGLAIVMTFLCGVMSYISVIFDGS